jgi:imidazolonepropionase-like amidohydrolase
MGVLIKNVNVFDGKNPRFRQHVNIVIEQNLVKEITRGEISEEQFHTVIDADGRNAIPGLTDAHVHLSGGQEVPRASLRVDEKAVRSVRFARDMLLRGFTTVRDAGGIVYGLKKNIDNGYLEGPRIFPSHSYISQTSGHGDNRASRAEERLFGGFYTSPNIQSRYTVIADGVDEMLRAVREQLFLGASQIKLMAGGGVSSVYDPIQTLQFTLEEMKAAVNAAADYGTYVMAHLYTAESMKRAAKAGIKSFEHASVMDEETAKIIAAEGIWVMPGPQFSRESSGKGFPESARKKAEFVRKGEEITTELIQKYQLPIVFGTDSFGDPVRVDQTQLDDFKFFKKRFGSVRGLVAATGNIHELLKLSTYQNPYPEGKIGVLEQGAFADLLLVDGNPVEDLDILADRKNIRLIMKNAVIYKNTLGAEA